VANDAFAVGAASMTALVAFNGAELAAVTGDDDLRDDADELAASLSERWNPELATWIDDGPTADGSGRARSVEALLGALVDPDQAHVNAALDQLVDPTAHGGRFGPTGVHRSEPAYAPGTYWRGPAWPQLTYLFWVAARRRGRPDVAAALSLSLTAGARVSGFAEYWHPDSGVGGGARPQSWTGLAYVVDQA
jgi:glycogen debranching enzyme